MDEIQHWVKDYLPHLKLNVLGEETLNTLYMTFVSGALSCVLGIFIGVTLFLTAKESYKENLIIYRILSFIVNIFRAVPFIILIILLFPVTKWIVGTILGVNAALPALVISAGAFYARLVELALREVDKGVIEASQSMGANLSTLIFKVLLPESSPALISGLTVTLISLVGGTAVAGAIGAGGLGNLAYLEGFQRSHLDVVWVATLVILLIVLCIQLIGDGVVRSIDKR
ncbi:methionine ABC transporter permease [Proteus myxofaciens]|uniref:D-methionine transport system permease protein MetI n=1 Tax=Proteus myxofaciens ATCC 19692 TaxID=1354337 RepID=A0A198FGS0_9GAMM|nr:methionine ABC transporter permease [Proteus myxofaciens]OAT23421.1 permease component of an ABC superfamily methionine transporter [Proteus myxofaciens ATCC 19692]